MAKENLTPIAAVVLNDHKTVVANDDGSFIYRQYFTVQVNNRDAARRYRAHYVSYDPSTEILELKGSLEQKGDKKPRLSKKKDIVDLAYFDGFSIASDDRYKKLELALPERFPAVYSFESGVKYLETIGLPAISFQYPPGVKVEKAALNLVDTKERINVKLIDPRGLVREEAKSFGVSFTAQDLPLSKSSDYGNSLVRGPAILLAPRNIRIEETQGSFNSWQEMAAWNASLLQAAGELPQEAIEEIRLLVKHAQTDAERIAMVYQYVQQRSHYVSIQLGIGGWQPMAPTEVHATGYGDCKALTNYTRLLLEAVGVPAAYCVIGVQSREIMFPEFVSANQANHAMLAIPQATDTLWLECTSQRSPPGYISFSASGRYALWVDKEDGGLVRTSGGSPEENTLLRKSVLTIGKDGAVQLSQKQLRQGNWLDLPLAMKHEIAKDQRQMVRRLFSQTLNELKCSVDLPEGKINPVSTVSIDAKMPTYAKLLGDRLMLPVFTFSATSTTLQELLDADDYVYLEEVSQVQDTLVFVPPVGMRITQLPDSISYTTSFLTYSLSAKHVDQKVQVIRSLTLHKARLEGSDLIEAQEIVQAIGRADRSVMGVVNE